MGGVLTALYVLGVMMDSRHTAARADAGPAVTIAGPIPLPVSGALSAQQSGTWNVGVTSLPAVNLATSTLVKVANTPATPVFFIDMNEPGRVPYQVTSLCTVLTQGLCQAKFTVPTSSRLVVQHVTGRAVLLQSMPATVEIALAGNPTMQSSFLVPSVLDGTGNFRSDFDQAVMGFVDGGSSGFQLTVEVNSNVNLTTSPGITVTGYLVDCVASQCANLQN